MFAITLFYTINHKIPNYQNPFNNLSWSSCPKLLKPFVTVPITGSKLLKSAPNSSKNDENGAFNNLVFVTYDCSDS